MENNIPNSEKAPIDRQEVINRLKDYGVEDDTTRNMFIGWTEQMRSSVEGTTSQERSKAALHIEIQIVRMKADAGFLGEAWDDIWGIDEPGLFETANMLGEEQLKADLQQLLKEIEEKGAAQEGQQ